MTPIVVARSSRDDGMVADDSASLDRMVPGDDILDDPTRGFRIRLGANAFLGGYVRYGGTSQNNFGSLKFDGDLNNTLRDAADVEVAGLQNFGFGLTLTIAF